MTRHEKYFVRRGVFEKRRESSRGDLPADARCSGIAGEKTIGTTVVLRKTGNRGNR